MQPDMVIVVTKRIINRTSNDFFMSVSFAEQTGPPFTFNEPSSGRILSLYKTAVHCIRLQQIDIRMVTIVIVIAGRFQSLQMENRSSLYGIY